MEQIRLIKEMRENDRANGRSDEHIRPRYMVWENVPGAFSSNKGEDFRCVLEETAKIADSNASIPRLETGKDGKQKWSKAGAIMGDGWSIAWRVHDAQFWGVPQRRKRISLVADFGGATAPEILFERKGLSGNTSESRKEGQGTTENVERGIGKAIGVDSYNLTTTGTVSKTLQAERSDNEHIPCAISFQERAGKPGGGKGILIQYERTGALSTLNNQPVCHGINGEISGTLDASYYRGCGERQGVEREVVVQTYQNTTGTLSPGAHAGSYNGQDAYNDMLVTNTSVVRRLTPLECERLQGYPDGWTDIGDWVDSKGKKHKGESDSSRYKALGNSIALPFWQWMAEKMVKYMDEPTMASLFDGIGGFPLIFSRVGAKPVWASEIEEFPMTVTKIRFPEKKYHARRNKNV